MKTLLPALVAMALPGVAHAQALSCAVPDAEIRPRPDLPSDSQPPRRVPIGSYTLAISWSPEYCRTHRDTASARFQCGSDNRFGFVLHGLWPDGRGSDWPQYCRATPVLSRQIVRRNLCATPSAQLLQHEWAKHGTCMAGYTPERYFARSTAMFRALRFPDMTRLAGIPISAGRLASEIARANPGLRANMMRITATRDGRLDEVWLCTDLRFRYVRCPAHQGGVERSAMVTISPLR